MPACHYSAAVTLSKVLRLAPGTTTQSPPGSHGPAHRRGPSNASVNLITSSLPSTATLFLHLSRQAEPASRPPPASSTKMRGWGVAVALCFVPESQFSMRAGGSGGRNVTKLLPTIIPTDWTSVLTGPFTLKSCGAQIQTAGVHLCNILYYLIKKRTAHDDVTTTRKANASRFFPRQASCILKV